ncbi:MAG TPA: hypothetical protein V6C46_10715, partial [Coleofasciculaceae cyanobacterium]
TLRSDLGKPAPYPLGLVSGGCHIGESGEPIAPRYRDVFTPAPLLKISMGSVITTIGYEIC